MPREREVSTRLIRPTLSEIRVDLLLKMLDEWDTNWEVDGSILLFDEGIAQYALSDVQSHHKFYAALCLGKASMRCTLLEEEPYDELDEKENNTFKLILPTILKPAEEKTIRSLKEILGKRGYQF